MPRILLTGSFGLVGRQVILALVKHNNRLHRKSQHPNYVWLTCFDKKTPATVQIKEQIEQELNSPSSFVVMWGDITNIQDVERVVEGQDQIIHLAAIIPPVCYLNGKLGEAVNVQGTKNLLQIASKQPLPPRFIFASSYSIFGPRNPNKNPQSFLTPETLPQPACIYATHKVQCEEMLKKYVGDWLVLRLGAVSPPLHDTSNRDFKAHLRLLFSVPRNGHRHGVDSRDCGLAFANAALSPKILTRKYFMIGGDPSWQMSAGEFSDAVFTVLGVGGISPLAYRDPSPDADDAYYYEDWMDTSSSQLALDFQRHTFQQWLEEASNQQNWFIYNLTWLVSPIVRRVICSQSPHYSYNVNGKPDPEQNMAFRDLCPGATPVAAAVVLNN
jgi:nucleoside-diphosphate-sugar epimerase